MDREEFIRLIKEDLIDEVEARELLNCSSQYINELIQNVKLTSAKKSKQYTLFLKSDVI